MDAEAEMARMTARQQKDVYRVTQRNPMFPAELSGVLALRAATR
jgi:hypothetical protein